MAKFTDAEKKEYIERLKKKNEKYGLPTKKKSKKK